MATVKSSINGNDHHYVVGVDPRPILRPRRCNTPLNNPYSTLQSILPDIPSRKSHSKKRVRFALTLESIEEDPLRSYPISIEIKTKKQIADTWHNDGPLYDTYVEYIQNKETSSSTTTTTYVFPKSKPSDSIVESVNIPLPPIVERTKKIQQKKSSAIKPKFSLDTHIRPPSPKKLSNSPTNRTPPLKTHIIPNEKLIRTDRPLSVRQVKDIFQSQKLPTIVTKQTKKASTRTSDELFFFQTCHNDHVTPIIH